MQNPPPREGDFFKVTICDLETFLGRGRPARRLVKQGSSEGRIYLIRGHKVMLDSDLAELYGVSVGRLNEAVKRSTDRFPGDFMFRLTEKEFQNLISQIATSSWGGI